MFRALQKLQENIDNVTKAEIGNESGIETIPMHVKVAIALIGAAAIENYPICPMTEIFRDLHYNTACQSWTTKDSDGQISVKTQTSQWCDAVLRSEANTIPPAVNTRDQIQNRVFVGGEWRSIFVMGLLWTR